MRNKILTVLTLMTLATQTALSVSDNGTIQLRGTVPMQVALVVTEVGSQALDLQTTASGLTVAQVRERSNASTGYTVSIQSANVGGKMINGADFMSYTATYDGANVTLDGAAHNVSDVAGGVYNVVKDFKISYTAKPAIDMLSGTYADTLTLVITSK